MSDRRERIWVVPPPTLDKLHVVRDAATCERPRSHPPMVIKDGKLTPVLNGILP